MNATPNYSPIDIHALRQVRAGCDLNGEAERLSPPFRRMVDHLAGLPLDDRAAAWDAMLAMREDGPELVKALAGVDPLGPPPEPEAGEADDTATLADVRGMLANTSWPWPGWLVGGVLNALAADPGTGKTILAMALTRRLWFGEPWPDGADNPFPAGSRTLWVAGDRHFPQLLELATSYGLPDEAILFNASAADATGGLELDDAATLAALEKRIERHAPAVVIIDTVGMTTGRNLCKPEDARDYFGPLMDMAGRTGVAFLALTHLSKDGDALGRRIVGACRTVWKITAPDPEGQPNRRRLWVDKSYAQKPPAMGMTIGDTGCEFDFNPPVKPEPESRRPGPPPAKVKAAMDWLVKQLTPNPARVSELRKEAARDGIIPSDSSAQTLYRARDELGADEYELDGRKWWKLPVRDVQDADSDNSDNAVRDVQPP